VRFTRRHLEKFRNASVPDLIGPGLKLLFVGINPGLWTAATQTHFAHPGNRFYPALLQAGLIDRSIDRAAGFSEEDRSHLIARGIGITNLVNRATIKASELSRDELREGGQRLRKLVDRVSPAVVAIAGITAYRDAFDDRSATSGKQAHSWDETEVWVVPNPSGLNAHETTDSLAEWYRRVGVAAGVIP
jgi:TDG/mug DNA glycosylase family protein